MEKAILKAIEGNYRNYSEMSVVSQFNLRDNMYDDTNALVLDPLFWQALFGKDAFYIDYKHGKFRPKVWQANAMTFHEINLTENWNAAVEYLQALIGEQSV